MRVSYLWGTKGKEYCELGRAEHLDKFINDHGAMSPAFALDETKRLMTGFKMLDGYSAQGENKPLNIRYSPLHLYKKKIDALKNMKPFAAVCVNGPEKYIGSRESFYSFLTIFDQKAVSDDKEYNFIDHIFGSHFLTRSEEDLYRNGLKPIDFEAKPVKTDLVIREKTFNAVKYILSVLYHNVDSRVVVRMDKTTDFNERSIDLLKQIYSLLPPKMALETGFSSYEDPANVSDLSQKLNTRIFVVPNECEVDLKALPTGTVYIDLENDLTFDEDSMMSGAVTKWTDVEAGVDGREIDWTKQAGCWMKRQEAMKYAFADENEYFTRDAYLSCTNKFFGDLFFSWEKSEKEKLGSEEDETGYLAVQELYKLFRQFPLCNKIGWVKDRFIAQVPILLGDGKGINDLKKSVVRSYVASDVGRDKEKNAYKNHLGFRDWLKSLDDSDITFESAEVVALDVSEKAKREKDAEWKSVLDTQQKEYEKQLTEAESVRADQEKQYQAVVIEKESDIEALNNKLTQQQNYYENYLSEVKNQAEEQRKADAQYYAGLINAEKQTYADYKFKVEQWEPLKQKAIEDALRNSDEQWGNKLSNIQADLDKKSAENASILATRQDVINAQKNKLEEKYKGEKEAIANKLDRLSEEYDLNKSSNERRIVELEQDNAVLRKQKADLKKKYNETVGELGKSLVVKPLLALVAGALLGALIGMLVVPKKVSVDVEMNGEKDITYNWQVKDGAADWATVATDGTGKLIIDAEAGREGLKYRCNVVLPQPEAEEHIENEEMESPSNDISGRCLDITLNEYTDPVTLVLSNNDEKCVYRLQKKTERGWSDVMGGISSEVTFTPSGDSPEEYRCFIIPQ